MKGIIDVLKAILLGSCGAAAAIIVTVLIIAAFFVVEFGAIAALTGIVCLVFGLTFSWEVVYGFFLIVLMLNLIAGIRELK